MKASTFLMMSSLFALCCFPGVVADGVDDLAPSKGGPSVPTLSSLASGAPPPGKDGAGREAKEVEGEANEGKGEGKEDGKSQGGGDSEIPDLPEESLKKTPDDTEFGGGFDQRELQGKSGHSRASRSASSPTRPPCDAMMLAGDQGCLCWPALGKNGSSRRDKAISRVP